MQIVEKRLDELQPYENNPRKNDTAVPFVAESIKQYGFKVPIVIDKDGVIVAGHTRYLASIELGLDTVPCIVADDLTDEQIAEFRLVDNKVAEYSGWDFSALEEELAGLETDLTEFGFDAQVSYIDDLMNEALGDTDYREEATEFAVTFVISKEHEESVLGYISENGKSGLVDAILAEVERWNG